MYYTEGLITEIRLPDLQWQTMLSHCRRKLNRDYQDGECEDLKAFGLLAGRVQDKHLLIGSVTPLLKNSRCSTTKKEYMDGMMDRHAVESETPNCQRGWVADPTELRQVLDNYRDQNMQLSGAYHMHRVAWDHDQERDTPTDLDTKLGKNSRIFMFIISMVIPEQPVVRAFFEGDSQQEVPVHID